MLDLLFNFKSEEKVEKAFSFLIILHHCSQSDE